MPRELKCLRKDGRFWEEKSINLKTIGWPEFKYLTGYRKILITGATGWFGRECISLILEDYGKEFLDSCVLAGSKESEIFVEGFRFQILNLANVASSNLSFDLILHFAFVTRGRFYLHGQNEFIDLNNEIRETCKSIILKSPKVAFFLASSGAVNETKLMEGRDLSYKIYADSKKRDEESFSEVVQAVRGKIGICRIYSVTGSEMTNPAEFAIGDLVLQGCSTNDIQIDSSVQVNRRYVDIKDLLRVSLSRLVHESFVMDSGGELIELVDLAQLISKKIVSAPTVINNLQPINSKPDNYFSHSSEFEDFAAKLNIDLLRIDGQIDRVLTAVERFLKTNR
jgi:nucleoside-diphosphate-sugar epimerase